MVRTLTPVAVYAKASVSFKDELGVTVRLVQGTPWASSDPAVRAHPELFSDSPLVMTSDRGWLPLEDV